MSSVFVFSFRSSMCLSCRRCQLYGTLWDGGGLTVNSNWESYIFMARCNKGRSRPVSIMSIVTSQEGKNSSQWHDGRSVTQQVVLLALTFVLHVLKSRFKCCSATTSAAFLHNIEKTWMQVSKQTSQTWKKNRFLSLTDPPAGKEPGRGVGVHAASHGEEARLQLGCCAIWLLGSLCWRWRQCVLVCVFGWCSFIVYKQKPFI